MKKLDDGSERYYGRAQMALLRYMKDGCKEPLDKWLDERDCRRVAHVCEEALREAVRGRGWSGGLWSLDYVRRRAAVTGALELVRKWEAKFSALQERVKP
jgi:hypothetical protein